MRRVWLTVCTVLACFLPWCDEAFPVERTALAVSGSDCQLSQPAIISSLERLEGVAKVEADVIPDHLLIDHDGLHWTGEELASFLNELAELHGRCRASVMKSCITAGIGTRAVNAELPR
jgi:hypothetical protein